LWIGEPGREEGCLSEIEQPLADPFPDVVSFNLMCQYSTEDGEARTVERVVSHDKATDPWVHGLAQNVPAMAGRAR
jgi:hypothetical protein